jgi:hypothetical protein
MAPRLLRHTAGTTEALAHNTAHRHAAQHALVHYASGAVFSFIPKNACTSLRVSLALANGAIGSTDDWTWVHSNNSTFSAALPDLARAPVTSVILRCPYRRLASTFLDKIVSRTGEFWALHRKSRDVIDPDRFTFRAFVDWVGKPGYLRSNIHWRPQRDFLVYEAYDRVFSLENMEPFGAFFEDVTGQPFVDARTLSGHATSSFERLEGEGHADTPMAELSWQKSNGRLPRPTDLYDAALIEKAAKLYAGDIRLYSTLLGPDALLFPPQPTEAQP